MREAARPIPMKAFAILAVTSAMLVTQVSVAQTVITTNATPEPEAAAELVEIIERQADQTEAVAEQVRTAPPSQVREILRTAELNGVGTAWFARRTISDQPIGSAAPEIATPQEQADVARLLRKQSDALEQFAASLGQVAAQVPPGKLTPTFDQIEVPDAALIVLGSPAAPDPNGRPAAAQEERPSVVQYLIGDGSELTYDYPSVAAIYTDPSNPRVNCTGTLVSSRTVVTAAHCLRGPRGQAPVAVFFQHAGRFEVTDHSVHPGYGSAPPTDEPINDIAVLQLDRPVTTIRPAPLMQPGMFTPGVQGKIVGFGARNGLTTAGAPLASSAIIWRTGIKLAGTVETRICQGISNLVITQGRICWEYKGALPRSATVCSGDSGGPLFVEIAGIWRLAGVTSFGLGGSRSNWCPGTSVAVDTDISAYSAWLSGQIARFEVSPASLISTALQPVHNGSDRFVVRRFERLIGIPSTTPVPVTSARRLLSVAINGTDVDQRVQLSLINPDGDVVCEAEDLPPLVQCVQSQPTPGKWRVRILGAAQQEVQLTALQF